MLFPSARVSSKTIIINVNCAKMSQPQRFRRFRPWVTPWSPPLPRCLPQKGLGFGEGWFSLTLSQCTHNYFLGLGWLTNWRMMVVKLIARYALGTKVRWWETEFVLFGGNLHLHRRKICQQITAVLISDYFGRHLLFFGKKCIDLSVLN